MQGWAPNRDHAWWSLKQHHCFQESTGGEPSSAASWSIYSTSLEMKLMRGTQRARSWFGSRFTCGTSCGTAQRALSTVWVWQGTNTELMGSILHQTATPELTGTPRQWGCACIHLWARDIHGKRFPTAAQQVFGIETQGFIHAASKDSKSLVFP